MDFEPSEEIQMILDVVRKYVTTELYDLEVEFPGNNWWELKPALDKHREANKKRDWWLPQIPEEYGGLGLSVVDHGLLCAELGRSPYGLYVFNCQAPDAGNMEILIRYGTDEQKAKYLQPLLDGETLSCFSMTEPDHAGSNPIHMSTRAVKDGDDWVINGAKWFTSGFESAAFAIVMAVTDTDPNSAPYKRASMIIVPTDTPGFNLERKISVMGQVGDGFFSHCEVSYNDVRVPLTNTLGDVNAGFVIAQDRLGPGRIHHCMRWIGVCERCLDLMCKNAVMRELAPGITLASRQFVQGWIAESRMEINAARLMVLHAAWRIDKDGAKAAREEIGLIKLYVPGVLHRVINRSIQCHGAAGLTDDFPMAGFYRQERAASIYDGPDEVHKVSVARQILKRYGTDIGPVVS